MSGDSDSERQYVSCPAPACNHRDRRSAVRTHLAEKTDQRHERFDGSEI